MRPSRIALAVGAVLIAAGGVAWAQLSEIGFRTDAEAEPPIVDLFVDGVTGVDLSRCGTTVEPCRTIQAAIDRIPMVFHRDIKVNVAPGTYEGGIMIVGRISPRMSKLTVSGEPDQVVITGPVGAQTGISVVHSYHVALENLRIEGFPGMGVKIMDSIESELRSVAITGGQDGLFLANSRTTIVGGSIEGSRRHGINCEGGWVTVGPGADQLLIGNNAASGLWADLCHVSIHSPVAIWGSTTAMLAMNAGEIDLSMRGDIGIYLDKGQTGLTAEHHGKIAGFAASCTGMCTCTALNHGMCDAGVVSAGGKNRNPVYDRND